MPPKAKFTKDEIIKTAFNVVRFEGLESLTARGLGAKLGSSARPIFTIFESMDDVQKEVKKSAKALYKEYVEKGLTCTPAFKGVGEQYIAFAKNEPKLFQLLFMQEQDSAPSINTILPLIEDSYDKILSSIINSYGLGKEIAEKVYYHLWLYAHGIATLCATDMCAFSDDVISQMLTEIFVSLLKNLKEGNKND